MLGVMTLSALTLQNFRSYTRQTFDFSADTTLLVGANGAGKTNVVEAIMMLATGKSFRADADREVIRWGKELSVIGGHLADLTNRASARQYETKKDDVDLELRMTAGTVGGQPSPLKKYLVNAIPRRLVDFAGNLHAVLFWPEDLALVTGSPSRRRRYLDSVLVQVDREYRRSLLSYERGLRQRNRLLDGIGAGKAHRHQLLFWNQLLVSAGAYLTQKRAGFIDFLNAQNVSGMSYQVEYDKSVISESRLAQYAAEEVAAKATLVGPHRDDFRVHKKQKNSLIDLAKYGSRGEQRLAILWLKLSELAFMTRETGTRPLLLLDDIFSELDADHRLLVFGLIGSQQTIVTSAEQDIMKELFHSRLRPGLVTLEL